MDFGFGETFAFKKAFLSKAKEKNSEIIAACKTRLNKKMVDLTILAKDFFLIVFISLIAAAIIFPIVFLMAFVYDSLVKQHPKAPKILLMLITTFLGTLIALFLAYLYLGAVFLPLANPA